MRSPIITQRLASGMSASASLARTLFASSRISQSNTLNRRRESIASLLHVPATRLYGSRSSLSTSVGRSLLGTLPGSAIRACRTCEKPSSRSCPVSTASLECDDMRIDALGFRPRMRRIASTMAVVLPVPGGPWMRYIWPGRIPITRATASACSSFGSGRWWAFLPSSGTRGGLPSQPVSDSSAAMAPVRGLPICSWRMTERCASNISTLAVGSTIPSSGSGS